MKRYALLWPLAALSGLSVPFAVSDLDLRIESAFYDPSARAWRFAGSGLAEFLYNYGTLFTWAGVVVALAVIFGSFFYPALKPKRAAAAFFLAAAAVGPGLVVNTILKRGVARPRPRDVIEFGGQQRFLRVGEIVPGAAGHSYPSGHASMGFAWLGLGVYYAGRNRRASAAFFAVGIVHGCVMGLGRMMQGGHFPGDVVGAALALYAVCLGLRLTVDAFALRATNVQGSVT